MTDATRAHPLRDYRAWLHLGWRDVRVRYSSTTLGPFWSTSALFCVVLGSSLAVGLLTGQGIFDNTASLALKLTVWTFIVSCGNEAADLFHQERSMLLNSTVSEETLILRMIWRNYVFFLHNLLVVLFFVVIESPSSVLRVLVLVPFGLVTGLVLVFPSRLLARLGSRFRDLRVLVPSVLQLAFFATPILWSAPQSGAGRVVVLINPIAWTMESSFALVFGETPVTSMSLYFVILTATSWALFELSRRRSRSIRNVL
jgi:ABC-type polysaccharide/polyol phosphate export permease